MHYLDAIEIVKEVIDRDPCTRTVEALDCLKNGIERLQEMLEEAEFRIESLEWELGAFQDE